MLQICVWNIIRGVLKIVCYRKFITRLILKIENDVTSPFTLGDASAKHFNQVKVQEKQKQSINGIPSNSWYSNNCDNGSPDADDKQAQWT